ncbi:MAG: IS4 family transposase [bacterium]
MESRTIFSQLMDWMPKRKFDACVHRYGGNHSVKRFSCWEQFLTMAFAQLTYRESLRDIETCLRALQPKLYHAGFRTKASRSTIADANEKRNWQIYRDFAQILISKARRLYAETDLGLQIEGATYALDSTTIDLCLMLFPWAQFRKHKSAIKLHTLLDLRGSIPTLVVITSGRIHDTKVMDQIPMEPGAFYIMDRGYLDFVRLYRMHLSSTFFVTRAISRLACQRLYSHPVDKTTGLRCDQTIVFSVPLSKEKYPEKLRRIRFFDATTGNTYVFLTNNFQLPALIIADLYRHRWCVELFFKWIKQHLRIKAFFGTSENAVKTQIWIAITVYILVAIIKKDLKLDLSLYTILQIFSLTLFEKTPILQALQSHDCIHSEINSENHQNQLQFHGF